MTCNARAWNEENYSVERTK